MLFNSLTFVVFFAAVLALHNAPRRWLSWRARKGNLLVASYLFYAAWSPPFVVLLWLATVVDFYVARAIAGARTRGARRGWLLLSLGANLGVLGYFKYGAFLLDNVARLLGAAGVAYRPPAADIVLPVGISFYTFVTLAYSLDVYLGRAEPAASLLDFALYVTFFPHLVAGPIVRPHDLLPQFAAPRRTTLPALGWGLALVTLGLFEKVVLADGFLAPAADAVFGAWQPLPMLDAWVGVAAFSGQIFFDFAGYSTAAVGSALALGFALPDNFASPYAARGFSDFWRRWHLSLSAWLRDYVYVPLGGNRRGPARTYVNLLLTMLIGGLWHGASWTFVAWGGLHGGYLAAERWLRDRRAADRAPEPGGVGPTGHVAAVLGALGVFGTFLVVSLTWVFFRARTFGEAAGVLRALGGAGAGAGAGGRPVPVLAWNDVVAVVAIVAAMLVAHGRTRDRRLEDVVARAPALAVGAVWAVLAVAVLAAQESAHAFIYFQF